MSAMAVDAIVTDATVVVGRSIYFSTDARLEILEGREVLRYVGLDRRVGEIIVARGESEDRECPMICMYS
jgi:hypothetical protein